MEFALGDGCRVEWASLHTKTLLDVFLLTSNLAVRINWKKMRQRERPLVVTIVSLCSWCSEFLYHP